MQIWPAIDLRGGKCVRLRQGDYGRETVYGDDPAAMARKFVSEGAEYLHLVDLDGARDGSNANLAAVQAIVKAAGIPCELGGGIRDDGIIEKMLSLGLSRLVVGTRALKEPDWFRTDGWLETSETTAIDLARLFESEPLAAIIYTDISRDGMLQGPNLAAMAEMKAAVKIPVIASGGVTTAKDVHDLATIGLDGCIIGRALYEGTITLKESLAAAMG